MLILRADTQPDVGKRPAARHHILSCTRSACCSSVSRAPA